jgi:cytochrome b561
MNNRLAPPRYTRTAVVLHWLLACAILVSFVIGFYMTGLPLSPKRLFWFNWHKWMGVCILALSAGRLLWRLAHQPPEDLPMAAWQRRAAHWTHRLLYALFFAVPLVGWAYSASAGFPVVLFGVLPLPSFVPVDKELAELFKFVHHMLAYAMAALIGGHVLGAMKHHFVDRDTTLLRMSLRRA